MLLTGSPLRAPCVLVSLLSLTSCTSGKGDTAALDSAAAVEPDDLLGGKVLFRAILEGFALSAELYDPALPAAPEVTYGDGHCDIDPDGEGDAVDAPFFRAELGGDLDLGDSITAESGETSLVVERAPSETEFEYLGAMAGPPFAFSTAWTLTNAGSTDGLPAGELAAFQTPAAIAASGRFDDTGTLALSGGEGASYFHLNFFTEGGWVDCYPSMTSTSFTLPAEIAASVTPETVARVSAETRQYVPINGHQVELRVTSDDLD